MANVTRLVALLAEHEVLLQRILITLRAVLLDSERFPCPLCGAEEAPHLHKGQRPQGTDCPYFYTAAQGYVLSQEAIDRYLRLIGPTLDDPMREVAPDADTDSLSVWLAQCTYVIDELGALNAVQTLPTAHSDVGVEDYAEVDTGDVYGAASSAVTVTDMAQADVDPVLVEASESIATTDYAVDKTGTY